MIAFERSMFALAFQLRLPTAGGEGWGATLPTQARLLGAYGHALQWDKKSVWHNHRQFANLPLPLHVA